MLVDERFKQYHRTRLCDAKQFVMTHTQPKMKMSVEKLLKYINPQN